MSRNFTWYSGSFATFALAMAAWGALSLTPARAQAARESVSELADWISSSRETVDFQEVYPGLSGQLGLSTTCLFHERTYFENTATNGISQEYFAAVSDCGAPKPIVFGTIVPVWHDGTFWRTDENGHIQAQVSYATLFQALAQFGNAAPAAARPDVPATEFRRVDTRFDTSGLAKVTTYLTDKMRSAGPDAAASPPVHKIVPFYEPDAPASSTPPEAR